MRTTEWRAFIKAQHVPHAPTYWFDFALSSAAGWTLFVIASSTRGLAYGALTVLASLVVLRAVYFVHEIGHLGRRAPRGFVTAWFLVAGLPFLIPPFMIGAHRYHHDPRTYGTVHDPEYARIATWPPWRFAIDLASLLFAPPALIIRFGLLGPLSLANKRLRRLVVRRMSTLAINPNYVRPDAPDDRWWIQEIVTTVFVWTIAYLAFRGVIELEWIVHWATVHVIALTLNQIRTYVAHRYEGDGAPMSFAEQLSDSITLRGLRFVTDLFAPVGDRFHALHHRYPSMPYHQLSTVHERLEDDAYRQTFRNGLIDALTRRFLRRS